MASTTLSISVPYVVEDASRSSRHDLTVELGLFDTLAAPLMLLASTHEHDPELMHWGWALRLSDTLPVSIEHCYSFDGIISFDRPRWRIDDDSYLAAALLEIEQWKPNASSQVPRLCWGINTDPRCATDQNAQRDAVDRWHTIIMPASAYIIDHLYLRPKLEATHPRTLWAAAAATLARAWLHFYAQPDAPRSRRHRANRLLLRRVYAYALIDLELMGWSWSETDQRDESQAAIKEWLDICMDQQNAWLFQESNSVWLWDDPQALQRTDTIENREQRREKEIAYFSDVLLTLLKKEHERNIAHDILYQEFIAAQLATIGRRWFLPRYNLRQGRRLITYGLYHHAILSPHHVLRRMPVWFRYGLAVLRSFVLGFSRLFASTIVGFTALVISEDSWKVLDVLTARGWAFSIRAVAVLAILIFFYLYSGIRNIVGYTGYRGTFLLWFIGEIFALSLAFGLMYLLTPFIADSIKPTPFTLWSYRGIAFAVILAQLALFIGVFGQLLFSDRSVTAPLDPQ